MELRCPAWCCTAPRHRAQLHDRRGADAARERAGPDGSGSFSVRRRGQRPRDWRKAPGGRMFFGIAPLGICGRAVSALSRLSSELTSLPERARGRRSSVVRSLRIGSSPSLLPDHVVVQRSGADHLGQPPLLLAEQAAHPLRVALGQQDHARAADHQVHHVHLGGRADRRGHPPVAAHVLHDLRRRAGLPLGGVHHRLVGPQVEHDQHARAGRTGCRSAARSSPRG